MRRWLSSTALVTAALAASSAAANPQGGQVVAGTASVQQTSPTRLDVVQSSDKAIIDWRGFSIGKDEHTNFQQPSRNAVTLNRVTGPDRSAIDGRLTAPGSIFLVNQNGIVVGPTASIDVGSFIATTNDIKNENFLGGKYVFDIPGKPDARVDNHGTITVAEGGLAALVAPGVANSGTINARVGRVALGSATSFGVDLSGDGLFYFAGGQSQQASAGPAVANSGRIVADGGTVQLTVAQAAGVVGQSINMSGIIEARAVESRGGKVILTGGGGTTTVGGTIDVSGRGTGQVGGTAEILGRSVELVAGARVDASGDRGGGTVLVGGAWHGDGPQPNAETTLLAKGSTILADAITEGDGGTVVAYAEGRTGVAGTISALGGKNGGNGGKVETSGKDGLLVTALARVDTGAPAGTPGSWLLDPHNIIVETGGTAEPASVDSFFDSPTEDFTVDPGVLAASGGNVTLQAQNDLTINSTLAVGAGQGIELSAGRSVLINANVTAGTFLDITGNALIDTSFPTRDPGPGEIIQSAGTMLSVTGDVSSFGTSLDIHLRQGPSAGRIVLANVSNTNGTLTVINDSGGAILGAPGGATLSAARDITLLAQPGNGGAGGIGAQGAPIQVVTTDPDGRVAAASRGSIYLTSPGDINFDSRVLECCFLLESVDGEINVTAGGAIRFFNGGADAGGQILLRAANGIFVGDHPSSGDPQLRFISAGGDILLDAGSGALDLASVRVLTANTIALRASAFDADADTVIGGIEGTPYANALFVTSSTGSIGLGDAGTGNDLSDVFVAAVNARDVTVGDSAIDRVGVVDFAAPEGFAKGGTLHLVSGNSVDISGGVDLTAPNAALEIVAANAVDIDAGSAALDLTRTRILTPGSIFLRAGGFQASSQTQIGGTGNGGYASALYLVSSDGALGLGDVDTGLVLSSAFVNAVRAKDVILGSSGETNGINAVDFTAPEGFAHGGTLYLVSDGTIDIGGGFDVTAPGAMLAIGGNDVALANAAVKANSVVISAQTLDFGSSTIDTSAAAGDQTYASPSARTTGARFLTGGGAFGFFGALSGHALTIDAANGSIFGNQLDLASLTLIGSGGSAFLTGSIDGITTGDAAKEVTRGAPPSSDYTFNGCIIGVGCDVVVEPPPAPPPSPPPSGPAVAPGTVLEGGLDSALSTASGSKSPFAVYLPNDSLVASGSSDRGNDPTLSYSSSGDRDLW
jgi:filamentous hemagglutinin family protein